MHHAAEPSQVPFEYVLPSQQTAVTAPSLLQRPGSGDAPTLQAPTSAPVQSEIPTGTQQLLPEHNNVVEVVEVEVDEVVLEVVVLLVVVLVDVVVVVVLVVVLDVLVVVVGNGGSHGAHAGGTAEHDVVPASKTFDL